MSARPCCPGAILQHGSIILERVGPQPCTGVNDHRQPAVTAQELADRLTIRLAAALGAELASGQPSEAELRSADEAERKYASDAWTRQR